MVEDSRQGVLALPGFTYDFEANDLRSDAGELVVLRPQCRHAGAVTPEQLRQLHTEAHRLCFVASSVNFPVRVAPVAVVVGLALEALKSMPLRTAMDAIRALDISM